MGYCFSPDQKAFHILVKMKDVPGSLSAILKVLADKVDLVESLSYGLPDGSAVWSGFGRSLSQTETKEALEKLIARTTMVIECQVEESESGIVVDSIHPGIEVSPGRPAMMLPIAGFSRICDHLAKILGSGGETILFEEGSALGQATGRYLNDRIGRGRLDVRIRAALGMYQAAGWGLLALKVEEPGVKYRIVARDCLECTEKSADRKECGFIRGHLGSVVSTLSGEEFRVTETSCRLRGGSACEFVLTLADPGRKTPLVAGIGN